MSWFRSLIRSIVIGTIAAIGGIFGNLAATVAQETFFQINIVTIVATIVGMILAVLLHAAIENWPDRDAKKLLELLEQHRGEIKSLRELHQGGQVWTDYHVRHWREHQAAIASIKQKLKNKSVSVVYSIWDDYPQPKVGRFVRLMETLKHGFSFFLVFGLAFAFVLSINDATHQTYLTIIRQITPPQPIPTIQPELTTTPVVASLPTQTSTEEIIAPIVPTDSQIQPTVDTRLVSTPTPQITVSGRSVLVRNGPSTDYEVLGTLFEGDTAPIIAKNNDNTWYLIQLENGDRGWVGSSLVELTNTDLLTLIPIVTVSATSSSLSTAPVILNTEIIPINTLQISWIWDRDLGVSEFFSVYLWPANGSSPKTSVVWLKESTYLLKLEATQYPAGEYFLAVAVIRDEGGELFTTIVESPTEIINIPAVSSTPTPTRALP